MHFYLSPSNAGHYWVMVSRGEKVETIGMISNGVATSMFNTEKEFITREIAFDWLVNEYLKNLIK